MTNERKKLIKKLDDLARKICFFRDNTTCVRCGRKPPYQIHWSHVITRENKALRWELENNKCLCYICHKWFHDNPTESGEWFKKTYPERYKFIQKHQMDIQKTDAASLRTKLEILTTIAIMKGVI